MIILSPGHDCISQGAQRENFSEHRLMEALVGEVALECHDRGIEVAIIDQDTWLWHSDYNTRLKMRIDCINSLNPEYFFEFHMNSTPDWKQDKKRGLEILVYQFKGKHLEMSAISAVIDKHPFVRQIPFVTWKQRPDLAVLRDTKCKAFLFECGYLNNPRDVEIMVWSRNDWVEFIADCIEAVLERVKG